MTIRPATDQDLPAILALSKKSLGELGGLRTEEYWRWKHEHNPFGPSPVLLAFEGDQLIGLRAFMPWRFRYQGKPFQAYRAVDTATHPDHRGKGIFSTLTMALVDQVKSGPPAVIFNTPNGKSMPGYLKMGWKEMGKTRLRVRVYPFNMIQHRLLKKASAPQTEPLVFPPDIAELLSQWQHSHGQVVTTDYTPDYLRWRYQQVPGLHYGLTLSRKGASTCLVIHRVKQSGSIRELRLVEVIYAGNEKKAVVRQAVRETARRYTPDVITVLADAQGELDALLPVGFFQASQRGLTLTARKVNDDALATLVMDYNKWSFSAGGVELF